MTTYLACKVWALELLLCFKGQGLFQIGLFAVKALTSLFDVIWEKERVLVQSGHYWRNHSWYRFSGKKRTNKLLLILSPPWEMVTKQLVCLMISCHQQEVIVIHSVLEQGFCCSVVNKREFSGRYELMFWSVELFFQNASIIISYNLNLFTMFTKLQIFSYLILFFSSNDRNFCLYS